MQQPDFVLPSLNQSSLKIFFLSAKPSQGFHAFQRPRLHGLFQLVIGDQNRAYQAQFQSGQIDQ